MSQRSTAIGRLALGALLAAGMAVLVRWFRGRRALVESVAPELRNPVLYVPIRMTGAGSLALSRAMMSQLPPPPPGTDVRDQLVPPTAEGLAGPRVLVYERPGRSRPGGALLWLHGGGMVMGRPEQDHRLCSRLVETLDILVVSVDYRLAPEHPFPAAMDDNMAALTWLHHNAAELGVDPSRIAVGGSSAGGGLAAALCQRARDEGGPPVCFQMLNYPMLDDRTVFATDHGGRGELVWTPESNRFGWTSYLGAPPRQVDERTHAAPARTDDLSGLPPAWIGVGELDLFHDEDVDYARRLREAGVECELRTEAGMYHGADELVAAQPRMKAYRASMTEALGRALGSDGAAVDAVIGADSSD